MDILKNILTQILLIIFLIYGLSFISYLLERYALSKGGKVNYAICMITGVVGTPIHELSHAFMCLLFGHKIEQISLYRISDDGVLGFVNHSYNKKNLYHRLGNFFIGIAPIIGGGGVIFLLLFLMARGSFDSSISDIKGFIDSKYTVFDSAFYSGIFKTSFNVFKDIFVNANYKNFINILAIILIICLLMHMLLSHADLKGSADGLIFLIIILLILDVIFHFISSADNVTSVMMVPVIIIFPLMLLNIAVNFVFAIISFIISIVKK